jgi:2-polyprenyl-3-methyl-5-hydroxy-6-metoxy-1,4-benzoquinol methylase
MHPAKQALLALLPFVGIADCARERPKLEQSVVLEGSASQLAVPPAHKPVLDAGRPVLDAGQPAIECPLAKQGVHPADLRPFKDIEKYIAFLERPERAKWQRPDVVVAALALAGNETVVDVGAGSGYFSFRLARALPHGSVIASDIQPEMVRHMHHKAMSEGVQNLRVVLGQAEDPGIPPAADLVFVCDVLHHVPNQPAWLGRLAREMKVGARLVLVEFKEGKLPQGPPEKLKLSRSKLIEIAKNAGLVLAVEKPSLLPYQTFLIFRKP